MFPRGKFQTFVGEVHIRDDRDDANLTSATFARYTDLRFRMRACIRNVYTLLYTRTRARKIARIVRYTLRIQTIPSIRSFCARTELPRPLPPLLSSRFASAGRSVARNGCKTYAAWSILYLIHAHTHIYARLGDASK